MNTSYKKTFLTRARVSGFLTFLVIGLFGSYLGVTIGTISLVNERKEIREEMRQTQIAISDLEVTYFDLAQAIDSETITQLGFTDSVVPVFAYTKEVYPSVALSR